MVALSRREFLYLSLAASAGLAGVPDQGSNAVVTIARDPATGALAQSPRPSACASADGTDAGAPNVCAAVPVGRSRQFVCP